MSISAGGLRFSFEFGFVLFSSYLEKRFFWVAILYQFWSFPQGNQRGVRRRFSFPVNFDIFLSVESRKSILPVDSTQNIAEWQFGSCDINANRAPQPSDEPFVRIVRIVPWKLWVERFCDMLGLLVFELYWLCRFCIRRLLKSKKLSSYFESRQKISTNFEFKQTSKWANLIED